MSLTQPKQIKYIDSNKDTIEVTLQRPRRLDEFSWYIKDLVENSDSFVVEETQRTASNGMVNMILWGNPRARSHVDHVEKKADYEKETAKMAIRFLSGDLTREKSVFELYSIQGPRLAETEKYVLQREEATKKQMNRLYAELEKSCKKRGETNE